MADLQFASIDRKFLTLYRNTVGRAFDAAIMYIRARLYPGIKKYVLQKDCLTLAFIVLHKTA